MKRKIIVAIPTHRPIEKQQLINDVESVRQLSLFADKISIVTNGPATAINKKIEAYWQARFPNTICTPRRDLLYKMAALRSAACAACAVPGDLALMLDEDIILKEGYADAILEGAKYLERYPECGGVMYNSAFGSVGRGSAIMPFRGRVVEMGLGMLLRVTDKGLVPKEALSFIGSGEEVMIASWLNVQGFWWAKRFCTPAIHRSLGSRKQVLDNPRDPAHDARNADSGCRALAAKLLGKDKSDWAVNSMWNFPAVSQK